MNLPWLLLGALMAALGSSGLVVSARVNGGALAGFRTDAASGFTEDGQDDDFSYEGRIDHLPGAKRKILAGFWLIILIGVVGALITGGLILVARVLWAAVSQFTA